MCLPNLKSVALPFPDIIRGSQNNLGSFWLCLHSLFLPKSHSPSIQTIRLCALVFPHFLIGVLDGVLNLQFRRRGHRGLGMLLSKIALVSSYRLSIQIIHPSALVCPKF